MSFNHIQSNLEAYAARQVTCPDAPYTLFIEPTNACNLHCVFCPQHRQKRSRGMMSLELFRRILADAKDCGVHKINLFFLGESLLHPDIFTMLKEIKAANLISRLNTNATLLTPEKSVRLLESGLDYLTISFDGANQESYEKLRVKASFHATKDNIAHICGLKKEWGENKENKGTGTEKDKDKGMSTEITVEMIQTEDSQNLFPDFAIAMKKLGADYVVQKTYRNWAGEFVDEKQQFRLNPYHICSYPWRSMAILWEGTAVPCCVDFDAFYPLGHASMGIMSLWNSPQMQSLRRVLIERHEMNDSVFTAVNNLCANCDIPFQGHEHCFAGENK